MPDSQLGPHIIETQNGPLVEIPLSAVEVFGSRLSFFGGGYLRLSPKWLIRWGVAKRHATSNPLIVYVHLREIDPNHPHLPLTLLRRFKCYVNLSSTLPKLKWLCQNHCFCTMLEMIENYVRSFYLECKTIPVVRFRDIHADEPWPALEEQLNHANREACRSRLLLVEKAMANFLEPSVLRSHRII